MIEFGRWLKESKEGKFKMFLIGTSRLAGYYIGWVGYRGSATTFDTRIKFDPKIRFEEINVPFREHGMIEDIFSKQWVNE